MCLIFFLTSNKITPPLPPFLDTPVPQWGGLSGSVDYLSSNTRHFSVLESCGNSINENGTLATSAFLRHLQNHLFVLGGTFEKKEQKPPDAKLITKNIASVRMHPQVCEKPWINIIFQSFDIPGHFQACFHTTWTSSVYSSKVYRDVNNSKSGRQEPIQVTFRLTIYHRRGCFIKGKIGWKHIFPYNLIEKII